MKTREIRILNNPSEVKTLGWDAFVSTHAQGNFFQTSHCYDLFAKVPGYHPYLSAAVVEGKLKGILLSVTQKETAIYGPLTARNIVWGGPLIAEKDEAIAAALLHDYLINAGSTAIYSQFRNMFQCDWIRGTFESMGFRYHSHLNYLVATNTASKEELMQKMSKSKVRQIKKAESHIEIRYASELKEVEEFYNLLRKLYREKVKKPLPPREFFVEYYHQIVRKGCGHYILVYQHKKLVGGIMAPVMPGKAIYEWYIAGLDREYKESYPSVMATWAAIAEGQSAGLQHFDFLGAGKPDADYGVREFKSKFGGESVEFGRFEKVHKPLLMKLGETGLKLYKKLRG